MLSENGKYYKSVALKTIAFLLATVVLAVAVLSLFFPKFCSDFTYSIGLTRLSASYSVAVYKKSNDINDLNGVFERSSAAKDDKMTAEYGKQLVAHKYFDDYCAYIDSVSAVGSYKSYVIGTVAAAIYLSQDIESAIDFANASTLIYEKNNAFSYLIVECSNKSDVSSLLTIQSALQKRLLSASSAEKTAIEDDLLTVSGAIK